MTALTSTDVLRVGTRRSALAMAQATTVAEMLRLQGRPVELVGVTTDGDRSARGGAPLADFGGVGVFVTELRQRLLTGEVDLVVHSLKDLPTAPADGLVVAAVPTREDPRDALVARDGLTLRELPDGAVVATGSPRRVAQLRVARPDLDIRPLRGNVDTRLRRVADGDFDAVVVAAAGLARLGRLGEATELLSPEVMLPAPGQGALAIECRAADVAANGPLAGLLAGIDHSPTRAAVAAERTLLAALEAGCTAPVGALAQISGSHMQLLAAVVSVDGSVAIRQTTTGSSNDPEEVGRRLATALFEAGAGAVVGS